MRGRAFSAALLLAVTLASAACREQGAIKVRKIAFNGVTAVEQARLRGALATRQSSRLPWGRKFFFDRGRFETDLKRIEAFYADRGYPDARVSAYDVKLNDRQDTVDITVTVSEGEPVIVKAIEYRGFDVVPPDHFDAMNGRAPLKVGEPRDRALVGLVARPLQCDRRTVDRRDAEPLLSEEHGVRPGPAAQLQRAARRDPPLLEHPLQLPRRQSGVPRRFAGEVAFVPVAIGVDGHGLWYRVCGNCLPPPARTAICGSGRLM